MSPALPPPLPFLPVEVKKEILRFCDQPTLAKTSGLSLAFLQLSSPLLYRHIVFEGPKGLTKFLTLVAEKRHPELEPWLNLSLVHSITYIDVKRSPFIPLNRRRDGRSILPHRLHLPSSSSPGRLALHSLKVVLPKGESETQVQSFFDPVEFQLQGVPGRKISRLYFDLSLWTRLRRLVFVDAFSSDVLLGPQSGSWEQSLHISYHLSNSSPSLALEWIKVDLDVQAQVEPSSKMVSLVEEVVLHVCREEYRKRLLKSLSNSVLLPRITIVVEPSPKTTSTDASST